MLEILINGANKSREISLLKNGKLIEYYVESEESIKKEGNIYIGTVKDIIKGMQAAFVDIGTEKNGFIHLKDILDKVDETKEKTPQKIEINDVIKREQKLLVQVKKDSNLQKGARVSTHINLPSKYIALMPNTDIITISQKIEDKKEQERLIKLVKENLEKGNGAIIRTSAEGKEQEIIEDIKNLEAKWKKISKKFSEYNGNQPKLIEKSQNIVEKMIVDLPENTIRRIITNNEKDYKKLQEFKKQNKYCSNIIIEYENNIDIIEKYNLKNEIEKLENRKIWLKCGGFITIDKTEALTAIDVNTGKYTGKQNVEQTVFKVNKEATIEIAKQLRLRDIGGIIIIDYIDMQDKNSKEKIEELLKENLKKDRTKTQVEGFTKLDLMEMTRKHICSHQ